jgi:hypothetical protein
MTQLIPSPSEYLDKSPSEWTQRDLFEREVDWHCQHRSILRPRCREWVEFSERFVAFCEDWNGCWVAETAVLEWNLYLRLPEGEYEPVEYEQGWHFRQGYP